MAGFEHLMKSYEVGDELDAMASSDPPAYMHRCFAEALSTPVLSLARVQQLAVCVMVLDSILNDRDYENFEPDLIADWRVHYGSNCARLKELAVNALHRAVESLTTSNPEAAGELSELERRLAPA
jgi:hypothetical protein